MVTSILILTISIYVAGAATTTAPTFSMFFWRLLKIWEIVVHWEIFWRPAFHSVHLALPSFIWIFRRPIFLNLLHIASIFPLKLIRVNKLQHFLLLPSSYQLNLSLLRLIHKPANNLPYPTQTTSIEQYRLLSNSAVANPHLLKLFKQTQYR